MVRFGPSGNGASFYESGRKSSIEVPEYLHNMGLNAYEYSFTRGVNVGEKTAHNIAEEARKYDIEITAHAPYYINFANPSDEMAEKSYKYVLDSLKALKNLGGTRLVIHSATQGKMTREEALELTKKRLITLKEKVIDAGFGDMWLCLETMGKYSQIGSYKEIIDLCTLYDHYMPTFDFGHINCVLQGALKSKEDYAPIFEYCRAKLGDERTKHPHIHFSKIEYNDKGEIKHLTFEDEKFGPHFEPLAEYMIENGIEPIIICESRDTQAEDALKMKQIYEKTKGER